MNKYRSYRNSSASMYRKIGISVVIALLVSNSLLLYLFIKEKNNNKNLISVIDKTNNDFNQIHESLKEKDLQKAFRHLVEAQKQVVAMLPAKVSSPQTLSMEKKELPPAQSPQTKTATAPPQAVSFLSIAIHSIMEEVGIQSENIPATDLSVIRNELRDKKINS